MIHVEVQSQYDKEFNERMFIYNYRAFDLYNQPVISLAILGDESKTWRPSSYQYGLGNSQLMFNFSIVKLLDYQWEELKRSQNVFAIVVMAHLKTKETTSNLSEREQWKWNLVRSLYARGLRKFDIVKLFKFIDKMMSLTPQLQFKFVNQLHQYEQEQQIPFLSTLEEMAIERTTKSTYHKNIIQLLQKRFGNLPESLVENINQIDDVAVLEGLIVETIVSNVIPFTDSTFSTGTAQGLEIMLNAWLKWDFEALSFPQQLSERGFDREQSDGIQNYYYREDGFKLWDIFGEYTTDFVNAAYTNDDDVANDPMVKGWITEMRDPNKADISSFPESISSKKQLASVLQNIIWKTSAGHAILNFAQFDYGAYVPNYPITMLAPMPFGEEGKMRFLMKI